jgi:transposase
MDHFAELDVSVKETSVCIVDDTGRIAREVKVASEPDSLLQVLTNPGYHFKTDWIGSWTAVAMAIQHSRP